MVRSISSLSLAILLTLSALSNDSFAQFKDESESDSQKSAGITLGQQQVQRYQLGVIIRAVGGPCAGLKGSLPMPMDWPEQTVKIVKEELSARNMRVTYRNKSGSMKQMFITIPRMKAGETAKALITVEISRSSILAPTETSGFSIPEKTDFSMRTYLRPSPYIESNHKRIRDLAYEVFASKSDATDWEKVEAIYDDVRRRVEYKNGPLKGALQALKDGDGDCEELTSLFVAMCRANKIPARTVWIPGHCYPEFYLVDQQNKGHWFPCQAAGTRAFGEMPEHRPILQKGDNFPDPNNPRKRTRYLAEHLTGKSFKGAGKPSVKFIRKQLAAEDEPDSRLNR